TASLCVCVHAEALHSYPFDGRTLGPVVAELEALTGVGTPAHPRRQRLSRPQPRTEVPRLDQRPNAPHHRADPPPCRRRAGHWAHQGRTEWAAITSEDATAIAVTPCSPLPATDFGLLLRWLERLLRAVIRALLAAPSRLDLDRTLAAFSLKL